MLSHPLTGEAFALAIPVTRLIMKRIAIPSAAALLMVFAGCSSMQPAANTVDIALVLETPPS